MSKCNLDPKYKPATIIKIQIAQAESSVGPNKLAVRLYYNLIQ